MSLLGLDIGTTNCKGAVYASTSACLGRSSREYATLRPHPGWAELDVNEVIAKCFEIIRDLASFAEEHKDPVRALCVCALGEAVIPVSKDRRVLRNTMLHSDIRETDEINEFTKHVSRDELYSINYNSPSNVFSLAKILWLRKNEPEVYRETNKFLFFGELLFYLLGCEAVTSYSQISRTLLFDLRKETWSDRLLNLAGLDWEQFSRPVPTGTIAGILSSRNAQALGLQAGVACIVGAHDQCCNALGVGIHSAGRAVDGIGTVECITPVFASIPDAGLLMDSGLHVEHHAVPELYISFVYNQAGSLIKWYRNTFLHNIEPEAGQNVYDRLTSEMPKAPTGLLFLPHLERTGAPSYIENSSGVIVGLKTTTQRGEILKAIMESQTFYFLECFETLEKLGINTSSMVASGGGARSKAWMQIKADIMGIPYEISSDPEAGVLGAAIVAAKALGDFPSYADACQHYIQPGEIFEPNAAWKDRYREKFEAYKQLYPRLKDILRNEPESRSNY